ncbi:hypothetical protein NQ318_021898 [Aromia moschata]|uniref:Glucuronosyltransferase n=1 Tax=Aromia moschata TaxID=1265417 RepID=A0AAV8Z824_9CUCU|nr:hypothetical protein NQ318_021898 [Aromia moschata]
MQIQHPKFKELIDGKGDFDLVMVNYQYPQLLLFGKIYNCPTILFSTFYLSTYHYHAQGNPSHPAAHTDMMLSFHPPLTFSQRFISTMFSLQSWYSMFTREIPEREDFINTHFSMSASIDELVRNVDLVFVSTHPAIHGARAFGPATVEVGYERKPKFRKPLEMPLKTFLDNAQDGFVYFSLGSNVKSKNISRILLKTIMEAIKEIPCTFLYKYEEDYLDDKTREC